MDQKYVQLFRAMYSMDVGVVTLIFTWSGMGNFVRDINGILEWSGEGNGKKILLTKTRNHSKNNK